MSDTSTTRMIEMYMEEAEAPMFLSGFFQSPPRNFHNSEKVELDIIRDEEDIAVVIQDLTAGARHNESTLYTNKAFTPPIFKEQGAIHAFNTIKRQPGVDPFQDPNFGLAATGEAFRIFRKLEKKIRRSVELMASQVLQLGVLTLVDDAGATLYMLDFQPKATHIATVGTTWATNGTTGAPLADLEALAIVVRRDGKKQPKKLIFGTSAWQRAKANAAFVAQFDKQVLNLASMTPQTRGQGATFHGFVWIGQYQFEMWTYDGWYKHPQTGTLTPYVDTEKVIMMSEGGRLDLSYGAIPRMTAPESRALSFLPSRMSDSGQGLDLTVNSWFTPDGEHLMVSAGTRPLTIPTAIDTFASLDVTT
jgi:major capsid protein E